MKSRRDILRGLLTVPLLALGAKMALAAPKPKQKGLQLSSGTYINDGSIIFRGGSSTNWNFQSNKITYVGKTELSDWIKADTTKIIGGPINSSRTRAGYIHVGNRRV